MTLQYFRKLGQSEQQDVLMGKGTFIADRDSDCFTIILFQLDAFYVELYYHPETNEIAWVRSFDSTDDLDPYLEYIDVSCLIES